jgi:hypothetical protein
MSGKTHTETDDLLARINNLRTEYKTENKTKKGFFPSKQYKFDCANTILKTVDLDTLLESTLILLPNSYHLFFDYTLFKTFAIPELYEKIIKYGLNKISNCIDTYGTYEMHINLSTFSISAYHRYQAIIELYSYEINTNYPHFHDNVKQMHVYNIPSTIDAISQLVGPMLPQHVRQKIIHYDKNASEKPMQTIMEIIKTSKNIPIVLQSENSP